jgi:2'-5' RNA ligase
MNGIFVTAELEGELGARIRAVQQRWDPKLARELPPHITVVGSSGAGPIAPDTPVALLRSAVEPVAVRTPPLTLAFRPPMRFIGREIVVLPLDPHGALRALQDALTEACRAAGVRYESARWPFTPHCTLNFYATLTPESLSALLAVREEESWPLHTLRVYHTRDGAPPKLLFDAPLSGAPAKPV